MLLDLKFSFHISHSRKKGKEIFYSIKRNLTILCTLECNDSQASVQDT